MGGEESREGILVGKKNKWKRSYLNKKKKKKYGFTYVFLDFHTVLKS